MAKCFKGYSLLEIILVTTFLIIFIIVINPGTYIDRFSKILLKMNVLNESELLINKMNSYAFMNCELTSLSVSQVRFLVGSSDVSLSITDKVVIKNHQTNIDAVLYANLDSNLSQGFLFYDSYLSQSQIPSDVQFSEYEVFSSLLDYSVNGAVVCLNKQTVLGAY